MEDKNLTDTEQINELAKSLCEIHGGHTSYTFCGHCFEESDKYFGCRGLAERLIELGYRKNREEENKNESTI